jgi:hypothetical protein
VFTTDIFNVEIPNAIFVIIGVTSGNVISNPSNSVSI